MAMSPLPMRAFIPPRKRFPIAGSTMQPPTDGAQPLPQTGVPTTNNPIPLGGSILRSPFPQNTIDVAPPQDPVLSSVTTSTTPMPPNNVMPPMGPNQPPMGKPTMPPMMSDVQKRNAYINRMAQQRQSNRFSGLTRPSYGARSYR